MTTTIKLHPDAKLLFRALPSPSEKHRLVKGTHAVIYAKVEDEPENLRLDLCITRVEGDTAYAVDAKQRVVHERHSALRDEHNVQGRFSGEIAVPVDDIVATEPPQSGEADMRAYLAVVFPELTTPNIDMLADALGRIDLGDCLDIGSYEHDEDAEDEDEDRCRGLWLMVNALDYAASRTPGCYTLDLENVCRDVEFSGRLGQTFFGDELACDIRVDCTYQDGEPTYRVVVGTNGSMAVSMTCSSGDYSDDDQDASFALEVAFGDAIGSKLNAWMELEAARVVGTLTGDCSGFSDEMLDRVAGQLEQKFPKVQRKTLEAA